jgi:hypothetical protein
MTQRAIKSKFSQENQAVSFRWSLAGGNDGRYGNRQVVSRAGFFQIGWRQSGHDPGTREPKAGIPHSGADTLTGFLHSGIRQTDNSKER